MNILPAKERFDLVIFDCDGTLVDSERLNIMAVAQVLGELGLKDYTQERIFNDYAGERFSSILQMISEDTGFMFPEDTVQRFLTRVRELAPEHMKLIDGAADAVLCAQRFAKTFVVSNGEHQNLLASLEFSGLSSLFPDGSIISGRMSPNPKPEPDLFLMAAGKARVNARRTLVIEDSITGVKGAVAANMVCWGFCEAHHNPQGHAQGLSELGAEKVFFNMEELCKALEK